MATGFIGYGCIDLQTLVFWPFFGTIFHGLNILSSRRLSSLYGFILGLKSKATHKPPLTN
jgi:hypothetical protein